VQSAFERRRHDPAVSSCQAGAAGRDYAHLAVAFLPQPEHTGALLFEELFRNAAPDYATIAWLIGSLHKRSFGPRNGSHCPGRLGSGGQGLHRHPAPISSVSNDEHFFGRKLMLEGCRRSFDVNFHLWLWAASSTNIRCRALRAAWTISVSSKSLMLRRIGT
jgi:hypothetical protein